jgi:hypothetical protein
MLRADSRHKCHGKLQESGLPRARTRGRPCPSVLKIRTDNRRSRTSHLREQRNRRPR